MRARSILCAAAMLTALTLSGCAGQNTPDSQPAAEAASDTSGNWKAAYLEALEDYSASHSAASDSHWDLQDVDGDGSPELLISESSSYSAGVLCYFYENGKAVPLLNADGEPLRYGVYGHFLICPEEHLWGIESLHGGYLHTVMDTYADRTLTRIQTTGDSSGYFGEEDATYTVNAEEVPKEDYQSAYDLFRSKHWVDVGVQYAFGDHAALEQDR